MVYCELHATSALMLSNLAQVPYGVYEWESVGEAPCQQPLCESFKFAVQACDRVGKLVLGLVLLHCL